VVVLAEVELRMQLAGISAKNHPKEVVVDTGILVLVSMISTSPILRMTTA